MPNADNIYMVLDANEEKAQYYDYNTTADVYKDFLEQMPGVSRACQLRYNSLQSTFSSDQVVHQKLRVAYADSAYVRTFSIKAVEGSLAKFDDGEGAETIFPRTYWISCGVATDESRRGDWQDYIDGAQMSIDSTVMRFYDMRLVAGRLPVYDKYKNLTHQETVDVAIAAVVMLTITLKILRSAKENPVEALKY